MSCLFVCQAHPTIHISDPKLMPFEDVGPIATVNKKARNKVALPCPTKFGNTIHMNIGYGMGKGTFLARRKNLAPYHTPDNK